MKLMNMDERSGELGLTVWCMMTYYNGNSEEGAMLIS